MLACSAQQGNRAMFRLLTILAVELRSIDAANRETVGRAFHREANNLLLEENLSKLSTDQQ